MGLDWVDLAWMVGSVEAGFTGAVGLVETVGLVDDVGFVVDCAGLVVGCISLVVGRVGLLADWADFMMGCEDLVIGLVVVCRGVEGFGAVMGMPLITERFTLYCLSFIFLSNNC